MMGRFNISIVCRYGTPLNDAFRPNHFSDSCSTSRTLSAGGRKMMVADVAIRQPSEQVGKEGGCNDGNDSADDNRQAAHGALFRSEFHGFSCAYGMG